MKETTRQKLIDATFEEVYSHGYQGAALTDILKNAGVHKGSMYHYFGSKKEMALTAVREKIAERFGVRYHSIINSKDNYLEQLFEMLRDLSFRDFERGCPLANLVQEMSNLDEDFNQTLKKIYANFREVLKQLFDAAIKAGEMKACDTNKLALYSVVVLEGAILSVKASGNEQDYIDVIEMLEEYFNTLKN
jgi:TetR/AcrR family transcriptional regulator, transcriptional repressor for nem operon